MKINDRGTEYLMNFHYLSRALRFSIREVACSWELVEVD
jgi:hypothetical protein